MNELIDFIAPLQYLVITGLIRLLYDYNPYAFVLFENHWNQANESGLSDDVYFTSLVWLCSGAVAELGLFFLWRKVILRMINLDILDVLRFVLRKTLRQLVLLHSFTVVGVFCLVLTSGGCDLSFTFTWIVNATNATNATGGV